MNVNTEISVDMTGRHSKQSECIQMASTLEEDRELSPTEWIAGGRAGRGCLNSWVTQKMTVNMMSKVNRTVVIPAFVYDTDTLKMDKAQREVKLEVAYIRMLRWMCGDTQLDRMINEIIRDTTKVGEIPKKVQEMILKWHVCV